MKSINMKKFFQIDLCRVGQDFFTERNHSILSLEESKIESLRERRKLGVSKLDVVTKEGDLQASFGWDSPPAQGEYEKSWFLLIDREEKIDYLWVLVKNQVEDLLSIRNIQEKSLSPEMQSVVVDYLNIERSRAAIAYANNCLQHTPPFSEDEALSSFIEKESLFKIPLDPITGFPHVNFVRWFRDRICSTDVVICGGNEYDFRIEEMPEPNWKFDIGNMIPIEENSIALDRMDHWLIWSKSSGLKIRISKTEESIVDHSTIPESVELRISKNQKDNSATKFYSSVDPWDIANFIDQTGAIELNVLDMDPQEWPDFWYMLDRLQNRVRVKIKTRHPEQIPEWKLNFLEEVEFPTNSSVDLKKSLKKILGIEEVRSSNSEIISSFKNPWYKKLLVHLDIDRISIEEQIKICSICGKNDIEVFISENERKDRNHDSELKHRQILEKIKRAFTRKYSGVWIGPKIRLSSYLGALWYDQDEDFTGFDKSFSFFADLVEMKISKKEREDCEKFDIKDSKLFYGRWKPDVAKILEIYNSWHPSKEKNSS